MKLSGYTSEEHETVISKLNLEHKNIVTENWYVKKLLNQGIAFTGHYEPETSMYYKNFPELFKIKVLDNKIISKFYIEKR